MPPVAPVFAIRCSASCWVSHVMLWSICEPKASDYFIGVFVWYVPRSGFIHEWKRETLQGGRTRRHDKLSTNALCELVLYACLFTRVASRARG